MFAGIVGVIPVVVSIIGPAPAVLLALTRGLAQGLFVLGIGVLLQLLEGIVIGPRLMSRLTGVSPFVVLCGIIFGAAIDGATGAFVAVPLAAIAAVALRHAGLAPRRSEITLAETRRADLFESAPPVPIAPR
ncbi:MAG: AI-2E family transporter [Candidatus Saccharimonadales bacterium]